jgi:hypothetical protein
LRSLETGDLHAAIKAYNDALAAARSGDFASAERALHQSRELLPEFDPADRLAAILLRAKALPKIPGPSKPHVSRRIAATIGAALALVAAAFQLGTRVGSRPSRAPAAAAQTGGAVGTPGTLTVHTRQEVSHTLGLALAGDADSIMALVSRSDVDTLEWSVAARERMRRLQSSGARSHFAAGLKAIRAASPEAAVPHLAAAARLGKGTYLEDDALYELARAQQRSGARAEAARIAKRLLTEFPSSIYANSTMRALADSAPSTASQ